MKSIVPVEVIEKRIFVIRNEKVMLDRDLAELYDVGTKVLKQAVRRNIKRFPEGFMFQLSKKEFEKWRSQFVTSKSDKIGLRYCPFVFTEQGVAMLSSVLKSERAIQVNILIIQTFVKLRKMIISYGEILKKIDEIEKKYDQQFKIVFDTLRDIVISKEKTRRIIGFKP
jgi:selenocysteine-specific translation elongation factor